MVISGAVVTTAMGIRVLFTIEGAPGTLEAVEGVLVIGLPPFKPMNRPHPPRNPTPRGRRPTKSSSYMGPGAFGPPPPPPPPC